MNKSPEKQSGLAPGFSLLEMLAVIAIFAVLALMAVPAVMAIVPSFEVRRAAEATSSMMYLARMSAANTQKPTRAVVNCQTTGQACRLSVYSAVFDVQGNLTGWHETVGTARMLAGKVTPRTDTLPVSIYSGHPANLYWVVFHPAGHLAAASHDPMNLIMDAKRASRPYTVSVDKANGKVTVR